jgi:hypothetical protein
MKVCILGNSHASSMKRALEHKPSEHFEYRFFASPGAELAMLKPSKGKLTPSTPELEKQIRTTSNGLSEILFSDYDAYIISGCQIYLDTALKIFKSHRPLRFHDEKAHLVSNDAFFAALLDCFRTSTAGYLLKLLKATGKRPLLLPGPIRSEAIIGKDVYPFLVDEHTTKDIVGWLYKACLLSWGQVARELNADVINQPEITIGTSGLTKLEYARDKVWRDGKWVKELDTIHTNLAFGQLVLEDVEAHFASA